MVNFLNLECINFNYAIEESKRKQTKSNLGPRKNQSKNHPQRNEKNRKMSQPKQRTRVYPESQA